MTTDLISWGETMFATRTAYGIAACALMLGLGLGGAEAFVAQPDMGRAIGSAVLPAAMCGYSCEHGGRFIPGPPSVCAERGMRFCGPRFEERPRFYGREREYREFEGRNCRTITIEREDGTIRRIRRCD
jgi:hypothetical protein